MILDIPDSPSLEVRMPVPDHMDAGDRFSPHDTQCRITYR